MIEDNSFAATPGEAIAIMGHDSLIQRNATTGAMRQFLRVGRAFGANDYWCVGHRVRNNVIQRAQAALFYDQEYNSPTPCRCAPQSAVMR